MEQLRQFTNSILSSARDLLPIVLVVAFFQLVVIQQPLPELARLITGFLLVTLGLAFFIRGLEQGLFPIGASIANAFASRAKLSWLLLFAFALGFGTTIAEPALTTVAREAARIAAADGVIAENPGAMADYALGLRMTVALSVDGHSRRAQFRHVLNVSPSRLIMTQNRRLTPDGHYSNRLRTAAEQRFPSRILERFGLEGTRTVMARRNFKKLLHPSIAIGYPIAH